VVQTRDLGASYVHNLANKEGLGIVDIAGQEREEKKK